MTHPDSTDQRRRLADRLEAEEVLRTPAWRKAVEAVPRELFLHPGFFLAESDGTWRPVTAAATDPAEWVRLAYTDASLVTQLDGHVTADAVSGPVTGIPTSSSTLPSLVVTMLEDLEVEDGHRVLEIGTGTGYSGALLCERLGDDAVTTIEVDPAVAARADAALEASGHSTWTITGDGLLGLPRRAPYDRVIAACAVRRIPYAWVRQTAPGGIILATLGSRPSTAGLARVVVREDGVAEGRFVRHAAFMQARAQVTPPVSGDFASRTAYADSERPTAVAPTRLDEPMPAFLAQLAAPGAQLVRATDVAGTAVLHLFDAERESFAEVRRDGDGWTVRQGGPADLWDAIERAVTEWEGVGSPPITAMRVRVTRHSHTYRLEGSPYEWRHPVL
ncbi:ATP-grasp peptide maturase system methyltransferase [Streptomyces sp. BI20]|uniref:ATP-grasp peptide maturase system methyltransferase n=1 Tax=Streptomyces sp. BI20 TaxID=3403460 RepID=UPI003C70B562